MTEIDPLTDFTTDEFTDGNITRPVYWNGEGPAVVVMSEIPGITPRVADFARRLVDAGFTVAMPNMFGEPGRPPSPPYAITTLVKGCVAKEFVALATNRSAPITVWLRALAREAHTRSGSDESVGVGAVGMCFTGGFALAMAVDPLMVAPVLSQPSMPFGITGKQKRDVGVSAKDLRIVQERAANEEDFCVVGLRFTADVLVPEERFARYRELLGDSFVAVEIDSTSGNDHGFSRAAHSVLTEEFKDEPGHPTRDALDIVMNHLRTRLLGEP